MKLSPAITELLSKQCGRVTKVISLQDCRYTSITTLPAKHFLTIKTKVKMNPTINLQILTKKANG